MNITFITGNPDKVAQLKHYLHYPFTHQKLDLEEIQSLDITEVVRHKAEEAYRQIKSPVLIEDTSLTFSALGQLPGTFIKWFLTELGKPGLCTLLNGFTDRSAVAQVCYGLYDGHQLYTFDGSMKGVIAPQPRGDKDFGWGPVFIPEGHDKTWGEMDIAAQYTTSIRRMAIEKLEKHLNGH